MSVTRALAWNTGVQIAGKIVSTAIGVVIIGLLTRLLGQAGFGVYSTANAYLQVFALLLDFGMNLTLVSLLGEHVDDLAYEQRCVSALFTFRLLSAGLILLILAPLIAWFLPYAHDLRLVILALSASFFFPSVNLMIIGVEQRHFKMHFAALAENVGRVIVLVGLLLALWLHWGLVSVAWIISLAALANVGLNFYLARGYGAFHLRWDPEFWNMALERSWPIAVSIFFNLIYYKADTLILQRFRSFSEVGLYGAAYRVLEILITVPFMYGGVLLPILSQLKIKKDYSALRRWMSRSSDLMWLFILPMLAGTWLLGPKIMALVAGPDFARSGDILRVLIIAVAAIYLNATFSHAVIALNAQRRMLPVYIVTAIITLLGYVWLIPAYGIWAAAWLTVFSEICVALGAYSVSHADIRFRLISRPFFAALGAALGMSLIVFFLRRLWLPIPIILGALTYAGLVLAFKGVSRDTLKEILRLKDAPINGTENIGN